MERYLVEADWERSQDNYSETKVIREYFRWNLNDKLKNRKKYG